ncbi:MAG: oligosaccharide flippase family protein [Bacteroidia bacterium]|nr:oligosaccharide flippase family protein [Bacteroidia bacterium]
MNQVKQLAGQTMIYGLGSILPRVLNFLVLTSFYTWLFGTSPYGILSELYAWLAMALVIIEFGMESGFFRFAKDKEAIRKAFSHATGLIGILAIIWMVLIYVSIDKISNLIHYSNNQNYILWMAWIVAIDSIALVPFAKIRQDGKARRFAKLKIANVFINIGLVIIFLVIFPWIDKITGGLPGWLYDPELGVGYVFFANLLTSAFMLLLLIPEFRFFRWKFDRVFMGKLLAYSAPLVLVGLAGSINDSGDKIFVKLITGDQGQVGIYSSNYRIAVLMTLFIQMFRYAFEPFLFKVSKDKNAEETYALVMKYFVITGLCLFLITSLNIDIFKVVLLRQKDFWQGIAVVPIVLLGNFFLGVYYNLSVWYKLKDLTRYAAIMASAGALITIVLNLLLVPVIGYMGAAWATLACYTSMMIISYFWGRKVYPVPYQTGIMIVWTVLALVLYGISVLVKPDNLMIRVAWDGLLMLVFIVIVGLKEKTMVRSIYLQIRNRGSK